MTARTATRYVLDARRAEVKARRTIFQEASMEKKRGPAVWYVIPLIVAFAAASRVGHNVRAVDFLQIFGAGMLVGVSLMGLIQTARKNRNPAA
jgi:hypothetical protein